MEAYLDNSATTRCLDEARDKMIEVLSKDYGNPSSLHMKGVSAEDYLKEARHTIAKSLNVNDKEIFFTSGGSESNNLAIRGTAESRKRYGNKIITTSIEHASVKEPMRYLEGLGFEIVYLDVDENGIVNIDTLKKEMDNNTILVSIMHVNNEIGSVSPLKEIGEIVKEKNNKCYFHVDAIQSYGKFKIRPKELNIDMLSVSGHKINGPKGSGFLYVRDGVNIMPLIFGGGQEKGMRSGTENVPAIAGLSVAASYYDKNLIKDREKLFSLKKRFIDKVLQLDGTHINGKYDEESAPHIVSVTFDKVRAEVLLHALEDKGIYVSSGSACSSNHPSKSNTLYAIGLRGDKLDQTIRFSFSIFNTNEEVDYTIDKLKELLPLLRKFIRK